MSLEKVAEQGGIPAQHDAVSVAGFAEDCVERRGAVTLHQDFGPRNDNARDSVELEHGALQQGGQVLDRPGEDVDGTFLEDPAGAGEAGDGMDGALARCRGDPVHRACVVRAHHEHAWTDPGATPRGWRAQ